jgi:uncharacterized membrane protein
MDGESAKMLIAIGVLVAAAFVASAIAVARERTWWSFLQLLGACLLTAVVLAHVAETFELFPSMGWGRSDTMGHYIDLVSALSGSILLPTGYIGGRVWAKRC